MKVPYTEHVTNETILVYNYTKGTRITRQCQVSQTETLRSHFTPQLTRQGHHAGSNAGKKTPGRPEETVVRRHREWTGLTIPDLVCLAQDRETYRRFGHVVAHVR